MESMQKINLSINYINISDEELKFEWKDDKFNERLKQLVSDLSNTKSGDDETTYDEVSEPNQ